MRAAAFLRLGTAIFAFGLGAAALAQSGTRLVLNGKTVSTSVRVIDGAPYVRLADVARALNMTVSRRAGAYELLKAGAAAAEGEPPGGANQVEGRQGKVGQVLFTGKWRFQVQSVERAQKYQGRFGTDAQEYAPKGNNEELVVITCVMKNGQKKAMEPMLSPQHPHNTGLADDQGQSYPPMAFDKRGGNYDVGAKMLPGAQTTFAVLFSVPRGTKLKDLVFSVQGFPDDYPNGGTDVRISLAE